MSVHKQQLTETEALIRLSEAIISQPGVVSVLHLIKDLAVRLILADRASIFVLNRDGKELWTIMADGEGMLRIPEGKGIVGEVIRDNRLLNIADAAADKRFYSDIDKKTGYVTRNVLCVPMPSRDGRALGAIEVLNKNDGEFTTRDEQLLTILGTQAGLAIEHVEMYEDIKRNLDQMEILLDIQKSINVSMEHEQIFQAILQKLVPAVEGKCGVIQTVTRNGIIGYYGYDPQQGHRYWEENDRRKWPAQLARVRDSLERIPAQERKEGFHCSGALVFAELRQETVCRGYIAVLLEEQESRFFNPLPLDYVKIVALQTVSLIDKREALEEKRRSEKQALLGAMLSTIVHDMRNPLSGITGFAQLIKRRAEDGKIHEYCDIILETLTRVERMNNELLTFVRGESIELEKCRFSLKDFFDALIGSMVISCEKAKIAITLECDVDVELLGDRDRLYRVFGNILSNAREAIGGDGTIKVGIRRDGRLVLVTVSDSGKGMPGHIQERIFQPFVTYGKKNGTGLGMAIAKTIVEKHCGSIQVGSMLGRGTTFTVALPVG